MDPTAADSSIISYAEQPTPNNNYVMKLNQSGLAKNITRTKK